MIQALKDSGLWKRRYKKYVESVPYSAANMMPAVKQWQEEWFGREDPAHGYLGQQSAYKVSHYQYAIMLSCCIMCAGDGGKHTSYSVP